MGGVPRVKDAKGMATYWLSYHTSCPTARPAAPGGSVSSAPIPASAATAGALVRWYVSAADAAGQATRDPLFLDKGARQYWGVIVGDASDSASLPILEM